MMIDILRYLVGTRAPATAPDLIAFKVAKERKDRAVDRLAVETDALKNLVTSIKGPKPKTGASKRAT